MLQPLDTSDKSVSMEASGAEYFDFSDFIYPSLLTTQVHEPQHCSLSGIDQFTVETLAENSQSQYFLDPLPNGAQQPSPTTSSSTPVPNMDNCASMEVYPSPSSLLSSDQSPTHSASPPEMSQILTEAPDGKVAIRSASTNFVCPICTKSFSNALRFGQHIKDHNTPSKCKHCGKNFKHAKDRQRHLGSSKAAPSCLVLKTASPEGKHFACICSSKSYTRKDTLIRHLRQSATGQHYCRACGNRPCTCS
ncbi:hypothetical protein CC86DRAFT_138952 [Ophiobolus disseminans]|uniref:C2H2-type domain-containing protein n=1 Tax=Ophiobolus disseminans TaxID=1469910 RepID=A0A6A7AFQ7_9PLEO|nr:hypothetical protein CC86DRAFT_138952 [Ophiobolus disseminans]